MEKSEVIKMLDKAKYRMGNKEEAGLSGMMAIMEALGYIIEKLDREADTAQQKAAVEDLVKKPKKEQKKNKHTVDYGKILALHRAGWTHKKIGEEMGVSGTAIAMALKRYQEKMKDGFVWNPEQKEFIEKG